MYAPTEELSAIALPLLLVLLSASACGPAAELEPLRSPLRPERSAAELGADLGAFVPSRLAASGVPGVSVAVVRDREIVFAEGFGVADWLSRRPVTPHTAFEVASHSKPATAYAALTLVDAGALALDAPLARYVDAPFLPPSEQSEAITLRHVLSHSSGLSNLGVGLLVDRRVWFPPGDRFSYSGHGYTYLGQAIEDSSREDLARHLERSVLGPLGMTRSGYRLEGALARSMARPHLSALLLASVPLLLWGLVAIPVSGLGWLGLRLATGRAPLTRTRSFALLAGSLVLSAGAGAELLGLAVAALGFSLLAVLCGLLFLAAYAGRSLWRSRADPGRTAPRIWLALTAAIALALAGLVVSRPAVPLPKREPGIVAVGGLLATAPDLARLLAELMEPRGLSQELGRAMRSRQAAIDDSLSWGLGIGIQHTAEGDALWHWGLNPGFESLMVGFPDEQLGVVVLTNGGPSLAGLELSREIAHRAIGGEHGGYWTAVPGTGLPAEPRN
ncbi:MAG: serine hydrolase domain-containing protein [Myxococcota bacterium]